MARDITVIQAEMATVRAEASALIRDGSHFTPEYDSILTRYRLLRQERAAAETTRAANINIEAVTG